MPVLSWGSWAAPCLDHTFVESPFRVQDAVNERDDAQRPRDYSPPPWTRAQIIIRRWYNAASRQGNRRYLHVCPMDIGVCLEADGGAPPSVRGAARDTVRLPGGIPAASSRLSEATSKNLDSTVLSTRPGVLRPPMALSLRRRRRAREVHSARGARRLPHSLDTRTTMGEE
ncbi:hypothetical protein PYCCODRAFT_381063 [Trametes coccinea BRFM310]|uniref:Uncharacterized protein n=1 Tax=Trametes coccinea (strain BRFM310) TaxID=1353009 RepID=A0A1Y2J5F9_TRAC3|nr:hypothetical protein PYCCODRAFT_381063 [Trametes coccinea BRFM310]